jgi:hypothetical protein
MSHLSLSPRDRIFLGSVAPKHDTAAKSDALVAAANLYADAPDFGDDDQALDQLEELLATGEDELPSAEQLDDARRHLERETAALYRSEIVSPLTDTETAEEPSE